MLKKQDKIHADTPHLLFCEGADAYYFLIWLLDFLKKEADQFSAFRVYNFGGIAELKPYLRNIAKTDDFKKIVRSICILRDAEANASNACQSIQDALRDCEFSVPQGPCSRTNGSACYPQIATGFVLFPSCDSRLRNGTLEDLCLSVLAQENAKNILADADAALKPYKKDLPQLHKNRLHTYFSLTKEFVSLKIGEAAKARAFSFRAREIKTLKSFLLEMRGA